LILDWKVLGESQEALQTAKLKSDFSSFLRENLEASESKIKVELEALSNKFHQGKVRSERQEQLEIKIQDLETKLLEWTNSSNESKNRLEEVQKRLHGLTLTITLTLTLTLTLALIGGPNETAWL